MVSWTMRTARSLSSAGCWCPEPCLGVCCFDADMDYILPKNAASIKPRAVQHAGEPADFVYTRNALHHLPDFWKAIALQRMARLLRSGGILRLRDLIFSFEPVDADRVVDAWLKAAPVRPESGWTRSELETHLRDEHSTFTWLLEPMLDRAGFEIRMPYTMSPRCSPLIRARDARSCQEFSVGDRLVCHWRLWQTVAKLP